MSFLPSPKWFLLFVSAAWGADPLMEQYNRAWQLIGQRRADEAIPELEAIIAATSTFWRAYEGLADVYRQKNALDHAESYFRKLVERNPSNALAHYGLGDVLARQGQLGPAVEQYSACIRAEPRAVPCYIKLADHLPRHAKPTSSEQELRSRVGASPYACLAEVRMLEIQRRLREARHSAESCLNAAKSTGDPEFLAATHGQIADVIRYTNEGLEETIPHEEAALRILEQLGDRQGQFEHVVSLIHDLAVTGDVPRALALTEQSLATARQLGHRQTVATVLGALGFCRSVLGHTEKELEARWEMYRILYEDGQVDSASNRLRDIGDVYHLRGDMEEARRCYEQALEMVRNLPGVVGFQLRALGLFHQSNGDYFRALQYLTEAVTEFRQRGMRHQEVAEVANLANVHSALGDFATARRYNEESYRGALEFEDRAIEQRTLIQLGRLKVQMGDARGAVAHLERARALSERVRWPRLKISALLGLGTAYRQSGQHKSALQVLEEALAAARELQFAAAEAEALSQIGQCHLQLKDLASAEQRFSDSLLMAERFGFAESTIAARRGLASVALRRGKVLTAMEHLKVAIQAIETLRLRIPTPDLRVGFVRERGNIFEDAVELLSLLHDQQPDKGYDREALAYAERGRARAFLDMLAESKADITNGLSDEQARAERELQGALSRAMAASLENASEKNRRRVDEAEQKLAEWVTQIRVTNPRYEELRYSAPYEPGQIEAVAASEGATILEFDLGERRSHLWVITGTRTQMLKLPPRSNIEREVNLYRQAISRQPVQSGFEAYREPAHKLYQMLMQRAAPYLAKGQKLVIAPAGILYYLPFETLISEFRPGAGAVPHHLIEDFAIVYSPSASVFAALRGQHTQHARLQELLAYGDPVFSKAAGPIGTKAPGDLVRGVYRAGGIRFPQLPNTRVEVEGVARLFPSDRRKTYLGLEATEASVKREKLDDYRHIHFATHAVVDERVPARSGIVLSLANPGAEDGILRTNEIFNLKLDADLVVLSACQTGLGQVVRGEGMVGLTRAFLYAGSPRVVVSLWEVNDLATPQFMRAFYRRLRQNQTPALALRGAKLEMLRSGTQAFQHPYFWAPFVLVGRP